MTRAVRNNWLLDECGMLMPDGTIGEVDRQTLVGDYRIGQSVSGGGAGSTNPGQGRSVAVGLRIGV